MTSQPNKTCYQILEDIADRCLLNYEQLAQDSQALQQLSEIVSAHPEWLEAEPQLKTLLKLKSAA